MRWFRHILVILVAAITLSGCSFNPMDYKAKSGLQVITPDQSSSVFIDGQYLNKTPLIEKNLKPGVYHIQIQPENTEYVPYETDITLRKGLLTVITWKPDKRPELSSGVIIELEALKDKNASEVSFTTIPDTAIITINNKKEFSPVVLTNVQSGVQEFEVTLPSYETQHHGIDVKPGYRTHVTIKLGKLQTASNTDPEANADSGDAVTATPSAGEKIQAQPDAPVAASSTLSATTNGMITILKTGFFQEGKEVLRVREAPDSKGAEKGFAPIGAQYQYLGEQKNGWYKISFNSGEGWVNGAYAKLN